MRMRRGALWGNASKHHVHFGDGLSLARSGVLSLSVLLLWWCLMMTGGASSSVFQMPPPHHQPPSPLLPPTSAEAILGLLQPCAGFCFLYVFWTELFNHQIARMCFVCKSDAFISLWWNSVINWKEVGRASSIKWKMCYFSLHCLHVSR